MPLSLKLAKSALAAAMTVAALVLLGQVDAIGSIASAVLAPGAWLYIAIFGAGHDITTLAGMLAGDVLFFTALYFGGLIVRDVTLRRTR
ncbi:MAG: hypothetical protein ACRD7E_26885 [Bryobacteraceae bacterium]